MAIRRGIVDEFETQLLQGNHDFTSQTFKLALFKENAVLNEDTTQYSADTGVVDDAGNPVRTEIDAFTTYPDGGLDVTVSIGNDDAGSFVEIADIHLTSVPSSTEFRAGLLYNAALPANNAVMVIDYSYNVKSPNGELTLLNSRASLGQYMIRLSTL